MTAVFVSVGSAEALKRTAVLFNRWPVLVEVRFPRSGTSPDWHLLEDAEELDALLQKLAPGVELSLTSVWDLDDSKVGLRLKR